MRWGSKALIAVAAVLLFAGTAQARGPSDLTRESSSSCGDTSLFGHTFEVRADLVRCGQARRLIDAKCKLHIREKWSCFSLREEDPFVVWFLTSEMFKRRWTRVVYYERYPCSEASFAPELFAREPRGFPSVRQLLADDLIRCDLLAGQSYDQVKRLLGPPDGGKPGKFLSYVLGLERDSFFQIDPELLYVTFAKDGQVSGLNIYQG